ncbi:MAG: hypothetical protein IVW56_03965 [Candidatus Binataceae bacterium]|nr:hypothetical protein [Candidatus Binataceae bacterium]
MTIRATAGMIALAMLVATTIGCAAASPDAARLAGASTGPATARMAAADSALSGVWQGISVSTSVGDPSDPGRIAAMQNITLTMFQQGEIVSGYYRCAYGNQVCRHMNETGIIRHGRLSHNRLTMRVMLEDGSMCFFTGVPEGERFAGGYECLQGGGIIEQGEFQTRRSY